MVAIVLAPVGEPNRFNRPTLLLTSMIIPTTRQPGVFCFSAPTTFVSSRCDVIVYNRGVLSRRRFMFLVGGAATGLWLVSTGLVRLERTFVLSVAGSCSFCGKDRAQTHALVGTAGNATRICDECVGLCCDILHEEGIGAPRDPLRYTANAEDERFQQRIDDIVQRLKEAHQAANREALLGDLRRSFDPQGASKLTDFSCSFCGLERREVNKLISGPRVFICDGCVGDAVAVVSHVLQTG
ncbi:MAG TPA: ClpX C4-type zinc finger protein [Kofleriaceae bacterium]|nr:ClpX C4-type zinc finger protein [Kofleriaceae bacterium]